MKDIILIFIFAFLYFHIIYKNYFSTKHKLIKKIVNKIKEIKYKNETLYDIIDINKFNLLIDKLKKNNIEQQYIDKYKIIYNNTITNKYFYKLIKYIDIKPFKILDNFLSNDECDNIIKLAQNRFKKSQINTANHRTDNNIRSSYSAQFKIRENEFIMNIENKIINLLDINNEKLEGLQITKYDKNDFYQLHHDYNTNIINIRKYSVIIYLNNLLPGDGGETHFPLYNTKITPKKGRIVYFDDLLSHNKMENHLTIHESLPILNETTKYILSTWSHINNI